MRRVIRVGIAGIVTALLGGLINWLTLPAWNVHSMGMWFFLFCTVEIFAACIWTICFIDEAINDAEFNEVPIIVVGLCATLIIVVVIGGAIGGAKLFNAQRYAKMIEVEQGDWNKDMTLTNSVENIALMDTDTAKVFGERALSSLSDIVSRYDLDADYFTQINLNGKAMKAVPLKYDSFFKWSSYKADGIPGYVLVDPVKIEASYVPVDESIRYSPSERFRRDLRRTLRRCYPSAIFDKHYFEIDETGHPYWITPTYKTTIGLFGGKKIDSVIILDACTGNSQKVGIENAPEWVDVVFDGDYTSKLYNYYGKLSGGFWNSIFSQADCKEATDDYGYITIGNDIWMYTGVTSVTGDSSNIGLIMANERTGETKYYSIGGADEKSAMQAAEGEVSAYGYKASFPSVVDVNGEATYVMVLTDDNHIVKKYAMVNLANYSKVAVADSQDDVFKRYSEVMGFEPQSDDTTQGKTEEAIPEKLESRGITVVESQFIVDDGETYVYFRDENGTTYKSNFNEVFLFVNEPLTITIKIDPTDKNNIIQAYIE